MDRSGRKRLVNDRDKSRVVRIVRRRRKVKHDKLHLKSMHAHHKVYSNTQQGQIKALRAGGDQGCLWYRRKIGEDACREQRNGEIGHLRIQKCSLVRWISFPAPSYRWQDQNIAQTARIQGTHLPNDISSGWWR